MTHQTTGRRWLRRFTTGTTTAGLVLVAVPVTLGRAEPAPAPSPSTGTSAAGRTPVARLRLVGHRKPHPHRHVKKYRVRPGDTPSEIAVRYHAWTAQLLRINHTSTLYAGQVILVPVVTRAARACTKHRHHFTGFYGNSHRHRAKPHHPPKKSPHKHESDGRHEKKDKKKRHHAGPRGHRHHHGWTHAGASRSEVRRVIVRKAGKLGVNPDLALAISWQEAGWQQRRVSSAGALGAMQVMPSTGRWMSLLVGRRLHLRDLHDNVTAGVLLIRTLRDQAGLRHAVAGYYQGLGGVMRDGMYPSTKRYVANVLYLKKRIAHGWNPA